MASIPQIQIRDPHVQISGSHGNLFVCPATGLVDTTRSEYDGSDYSAIVMFDVGEWEQHYHELFTGGDILDYAFWSRETDPASANWGRVTLYEPADPQTRRRWPEVMRNRCEAFVDFTYYPCFALDASGAPVPYRDPRVVAHDCAIGHEKDPNLGCWSVFGIQPDRTLRELSDHSCAAHAAARCEQWEKALAATTTKH